MTNRPTFPTQSLAHWIQRFFDNDWMAAPATSRLPAALTGDVMPAVNLGETDKEVTVSVELPGLEEKDIDVSWSGNQLCIKAERKFEAEKKEKHYHYVESQYGTFARTLVMPEGLKRDQVDARFKNGVLTLTIPKVEPTPATKVKVKAG
ncbi:MAG: Hsp20/alpha crystallin family protein [Planctomycetota bacterium]